MICLSRPQPGPDQVHDVSRRLDASLRLLLERVKDVHTGREPDGIHRTIGVSVVVLDDLQDAGALEALEWLDRLVPPANCAVRSATPTERWTARGN